MRTVLLIDYLFPPLGGAGVQRTLGYVRHLREHGWAPVVLTVKAGEHSFHDASLLERVPADVVVRRSGSLEPVRFIKALAPQAAAGSRSGNGRGGGWLRSVARRLQALEPWLLFPDRRLGWLPFGVAEALSMARRRRVDVIYSTSTVVTSHLIAYVLKRLWDVPWVADFQDPWARNYVSQFPSRAHQGVADYLEAVIVRTADAVTVTTGPLRDALRRHHPAVPPAKFTVIPMGFDPDTFARIPRRRRAKFTLTHFGNFYGPRSPGPFLTALGARVREDPELARRVEVLLFGGFDPPLRALAEEIIRRDGLGDIVRIRGAVPYERGVEEVASSDVLLLVTDPGGCGQDLIPSKLYEYLGARRTVLALAPDGAVADVMRATGAGVVAAPDDVEAIGRAITTLYGQWKGGLLEGPVNEEALGQFTWPVLAAQFAATLDGVLAGSGEPSPAR